MPPARCHVVVCRHTGTLSFRGNYHQNLWNWNSFDGRKAVRSVGKGQWPWHSSKLSLLCHAPAITLFISPLSPYHVWSTASDCVLINYSPKAISRRRQDGSTHLRARAVQRHHYIHPSSTAATEMCHGPNITSHHSTSYALSDRAFLHSSPFCAHHFWYSYSDKPFGLDSKLMLLETNISLKGLEESSSSDFPIVHWSSVRDLCVCYWYLFDQSAGCEAESLCLLVESSWNVIAHGDAQEGKWRRNWRKEWVASTLHTTSGHGVSSITTADAHTSATSSRLNWRPHRFKWTRPFRRKTKSSFCECAITFQTVCYLVSTTSSLCRWLQLPVKLTFLTTITKSAIAGNAKSAVCHNTDFFNLNFRGCTDWDFVVGYHHFGSKWLCLQGTREEFQQNYVGSG